jgi:hypothetical protein
MGLSTQAPLASHRVDVQTLWSSQDLPAGAGKLHVPSFPGTLQAQQFVEHVVLQQKPSLQSPLWHSTSAAQAMPITFLAWHCGGLPVAQY